MKAKKGLEPVIAEAHKHITNKPFVKKVPFPKEEYYHDKHPKTQIVLHHTVSGKGQSGDINWWKSRPEHIATAFIIGRDGTIIQLFDESLWAHHLGVKSYEFKKFELQSNNAGLNQMSIGIELDSWGGLKDNTKVDEYVEYPDKFRGYYFFEKYYNPQLDAARDLIVYLCNKYNIPKDYNPDMWEQNPRALGGEPGIWTHVSYRKDKSDLHPQSSVITMLETLKLY